VNGNPLVWVDPLGLDLRPFDGNEGEYNNADSFSSAVSQLVNAPVGNSTITIEQVIVEDVNVLGGKDLKLKNISVEIVKDDQGNVDFEFKKGLVTASGSFDYSYSYNTVAHTVKVENIDADVKVAIFRVADEDLPTSARIDIFDVDDSQKKQLPNNALVQAEVTYENGRVDLICKTK
jgi:hypothetical protein